MYWYGVVREPCGGVFRSLLHDLASKASSLTLVERDGVGLGSVIEPLWRLCPPESFRSGSWPGTQLSQPDEATVYRLPYNLEVATQIVALEDCLFGWRQPHLPEDIALYRDDGRVVLGSIAHERDAFLIMSEDEMAQLLSTVPQLAVVRESPFDGSAL